MGKERKKDEGVVAISREESRKGRGIGCVSLLLHIIIISVFLEVSLLVGQYFRLRVPG